LSRAMPATHAQLSTVCFGNPTPTDKPDFQGQ
jgi:hypothetical protein